MIDIDFSLTNLQILLQARDIARQDPRLAAALLDAPEEFGRLLGRVSPEALARVAYVNAPLFVPRADPWWWQRFFETIHRGRPEEVRAVLNHGCVIATPRTGGRAVTCQR